MDDMKQKVKDDKAKENLRLGIGTQLSQQEQQEEASRVIQSMIRGVTARKEISQLRLEEMQFLGMMRPPKTLEEQKRETNAERVKEKTERERREDRMAKQNEYEEAKKTVEREIYDNE